MHVVPIYGWGWSAGFGFNVPPPFELDAEVQEVPFHAAAGRLYALHPLQGMFVVLTRSRQWKTGNTAVCPLLLGAHLHYLILNGS